MSVYRAAQAICGFLSESRLCPQRRTEIRVWRGDVTAAFLPTQPAALLCLLRLGLPCLLQTRELGSLTTHRPAPRGSHEGAPPLPPCCGASAFDPLTWDETTSLPPPGNNMSKKENDSCRCVCSRMHTHAHTHPHPRTSPHAHTQCGPGLKHSFNQPFTSGSQDPAG